MERAFRESVIGANGDVKFPAGVFFEWPKTTFQQVAKNLGQSVEDLTVTKEEAGSMFSVSVISKGKKQPLKGEKSKSKKGQSRARLQE